MVTFSEQNAFQSVIATILQIAVFHGETHVFSAKGCSEDAFGFIRAGGGAGVERKRLTDQRPRALGQAGELDAALSAIAAARRGISAWAKPAVASGAVSA